MSDDQDTTAPGRVNITIKRVEVPCDDPDRFIHQLNKAVARELAAPAASVMGWPQPPDPAHVALCAKLARRARWRRRLRKVGLSAAVAIVMALAVIGAASLF